MKKKLQIFALITGQLDYYRNIYATQMYKENELRNYSTEIAKLKDENLSLVSISNKTNRYLMKENDDSQTIFNQFMEQKRLGRKQTIWQESFIHSARKRDVS